jgi:hypothetical protein
MEGGRALPCPPHREVGARPAPGPEPPLPAGQQRTAPWSPRQLACPLCRICECRGEEWVKTGYGGQWGLRSVIIRNPHQAQPTTHNPQPTTHNPQPTTHNPQPTTHNPQPTTHNPQPTTHNPQPTTTAIHQLEYQPTPTLTLAPQRPEKCLRSWWACSPGWLTLVWGIPMTTQTSAATHTQQPEKCEGHWCLYRNHMQPPTHPSIHPSHNPNEYLQIRGAGRVLGMRCPPAHQS